MKENESIIAKVIGGTFRRGTLSSSKVSTNKSCNGLGVEESSVCSKKNNELSISKSEHRSMVKPLESHKIGKDSSGRDKKWLNFFRMNNSETVSTQELDDSSSVSRRGSISLISSRLSKLGLTGTTPPTGLKDNDPYGKKTNGELYVVQKSKEDAPTDDLYHIKRLGLYDVGATIGKGTFSKVKMGVNLITKQKAAIKIIEKNENHRGFTTKHIFQEVNVQKCANHRRVCQILNVFDTGSYVCIVLEFAPTDLLQYINSTWTKRLTDCESRRLFYQLIDAVSYLHDLNIVHRDIKPQNVLLDNEFNVKLTDFGFGKQCTETNGDMLSTVCGSNVYAAPELVRYKQPYSGRPADIWACGIVLYNMLVGKMPFKDLGDRVRTEARHVLYDPLISENVLVENLTFPAHVHAAAAHLLQKTICINFKARYTSANIFEHEWMQLSFPNGPDPAMRTRLKRRPSKTGVSNPTGYRPMPAVHGHTKKGSESQPQVPNSPCASRNIKDLNKLPFTNSASASSASFENNLEWPPRVHKTRGTGCNRFNGSPTTTVRTFSASSNTPNPPSAEHVTTRSTEPHKLSKLGR
eukprot:CFRG4941T1